MTPPASQHPQRTDRDAQRKAFYETLAAHGMTPLWEVLRELVPPAPATPCEPAIWKYADVRPCLMQACQLITAEDAVRRVVILENPATGGWPMPTLATFMPRLPAGFAGKPYRQTDGAVFSVVEGSGTVTLTRNNDAWTFEFGPHDHFVIPSWHTAQLRSAHGCVLFSFTERPVHQALGIHREERLS